MKGMHFLQNKRNHNLILTITDFFPLEDKIMFIFINKITKSILKSQSFFQDLKTFIKRLKEKKNCLFGSLLENNASMIRKIIEEENIQLNDSIITEIMVKFINKNHFEKSKNLFI